MWLHKYKWGGGTYHVIRGGGGKRLGRPYSGPKGPASSGHGPSPLLTKCPLSSANQQYILPISRYTLSHTVLLISAIFFWLSPPAPSPISFVCSPYLPFPYPFTPPSRFILSSFSLSPIFFSEFVIIYYFIKPSRLAQCSYHSDNYICRYLHIFRILFSKILLFW